MKHLILLGLVFFGLSAGAQIGKKPDKVGNGGGVWTCEDPARKVYQILFRDTFEARSQFGLTLPDLKIPVEDAIKTWKLWIDVNLPDHAQISAEIDAAEKMIQWTDDELTVIDDAFEKLKPHALRCPEGKWEPRQLANYTEEGYLLISREYFFSPLFTDLDRAALFIHEGVYTYLRARDGDQNSVRARRIVGYVLSDLPDAEKVSKILEVIGQGGGVDDGGDDDDVEPANGYICGLKPGEHNALYISEAVKEADARAAVIKACKDGENPFKNHPGMGGDGLGFPDFGQDIGPGSECKEVKVRCEPFTSAVKSVTCKYMAGFHEKVWYEGKGRTALEAQHDAINRCMTATGDEHGCYRGEQLTCK
jgi:hypothetical protein